MKISNYIEMQLRLFKKHLKKALSNKRRRSIHQLRVALKKVFAISKVLELHIEDADSYKAIQKKIKILFKHAGAIRDNQLMIAYARKWLPFKEKKQLKRACDFHIQSAFSVLQKEVDIVDLKRLVGDYLAFFIDVNSIGKSGVQESLLEHVNLREVEIRDELKRDDVDFHLIRKWTKEQCYLLTFFKEDFKVDINKEMRKLKKKQGEILGLWHDLVVFKQFLKESGLKIREGVYKRLDKETRYLVNQIERAYV
jgi:CHAD domain-containing protein